MLIAWLIFFSPILLKDKAYFTGDIKDIYYPLEHVYAQFQANWELPVWSNEFGFGHPLLAWGQLGFFTPVHVLLRIFSVHPLGLLHISMMVYFALGLAGMFTFLRARKLSHPASTLGSLLFVFNGFIVGHLLHVNFYTSALLLPWLLLTIHFLLQRPTVLRMIGLTLIASAIVLSGQPQVVLFTFIIAAIVGIALFIEYLIQTKARLKQTMIRIGFISVAGVLALGISSFAIFPLLEFIPSTERNESLPLEELYEFSYPPQHAITLVAPNFFGTFDEYRGAKSRDELSAFVGIIPLLLSVFAVILWRYQKAERAAGLTLVLVALAMAPGKYSPFYRYLVEHHILTSVGVPGRYSYFFVVGICLLAAVGLEDVARISWRQLKRPLTWSLVVLSCGTLLFYSSTYHPVVERSAAFAPLPFRSTLASYRERAGQPPRLYSRPALATGDSPQPFLPIGAYISPTFSIRQSIPAADIQRGCIVIPFRSEPAAQDTYITVALHDDIAAPAEDQLRITSLDIQREPNQAVCFNSWQERKEEASYVLSLTSDHESNITTYVAAKESPHDPGVYLIRVAQPTAEQLTRSQKESRLAYRRDQSPSLSPDLAVLNRHLQATTGTSSARWIGALAIRPYREFIEKFFANDSSSLIDGDGRHLLDRRRTLFDMSGVTHLAQAVPSGAPDPLPDMGFTKVDEVQDGKTLFRLYENPQAYPKAYIVPEAKFIPAADETRHALMDPLFDPRAVVYLSGPTPPQLPPPSDTLLEASAKVRTYKPTQIDIETTTNQDAFLVVTDSTSPQWKTYIDGQPSLRLVGNSVFKAAQIPAGSHTISFRYESPAIRVATNTTMISSTVIAGLVIVSAVLALRSFQRRSL